MDKEKIERFSQLIKDSRNIVFFGGADIPTVTHVDYSARIQTVSEDTNPFFYNILKCFKSITGCSVMVNTSFNTNQEPIVNNAVDAYRSFMRSGIDYAVIGNRLFDKKAQPENPPEGGKW